MARLSENEAQGRKLQMARSGTLPTNAYCEELKPVSVAGKEYSDEHESDSKILQYYSDKASVESKESDNKES